MVATAAAPIVYGRVEPVFTGQTVVCAGSGPSLTVEDLESCRGRAKVIAIKDVIDLAPWADVLYACGDDASHWWQRHGDRLAGYPGLRYTLDPKAAAWATVLKQAGVEGLEADPSGLRTGRNSGFQAINLAVHLGAARIVLLGYDLQPSAAGQHHFFPDRAGRVPPPFAAFRPLFATLIAPLQALGIPIVNASRQTALTCLPRASLAAALAQAQVAA